MKKRQPVALLSAGKLADSPVTRFWALADHLGPVKAPSLRLASRAVNTLRAGYAVDTCDDFEHCTLILISVPDETVPATIEELCASRLTWHNKAVVLCSAWLDGTALQPLAIQGASVGSVTPIPGFEDRQYLVEGNGMVVREVQSLVGRRGTRILAIDPPLKPFFLAAVNCTGALLYSLLTAAAECIRQTGIPAADAEAIIHNQVERTLRSYFVAGRNADPQLKGLAKQLHSLAMVQPAVAEYLQGMAKLSASLMSGTARAAAARGSSTS